MTAAGRGEEGPEGAAPPPAPDLGAFGEAAQDFAALAPHLWDRVAAVDPEPGEPVLDACCGTGASALPTTERVGPAGRVDAVDLEGSMTRCAPRRTVGAWPTSPRTPATSLPSSGTATTLSSA